MECQDLLARIFVANPAERISLADVKRHPWFLHNLPVELAVRADEQADWQAGG
jgi:serine/threonine-protein kinase SRK2